MKIKFSVTFLFFFCCEIKDDIYKVEPHKINWDLFKKNIKTLEKFKKVDKIQKELHQRPLLTSIIFHSELTTLKHFLSIPININEKYHYDIEAIVNPISSFLFCLIFKEHMKVDMSFFEELMSHDQNLNETVDMNCDQQNNLDPFELSLSYKFWDFPNRLLEIDFYKRRSFKYHEKVDFINEFLDQTNDYENAGSIFLNYAIYYLPGMYFCTDILEKRLSSIKEFGNLNFRYFPKSLLNLILYFLEGGNRIRIKFPKKIDDPKYYALKKIKYIMPNKTYKNSKK